MTILHHLQKFRTQIIRAHPSKTRRRHIKKKKKKKGSPSKVDAEATSSKVKKISPKKSLLKKSTSPGKKKKTKLDKSDKSPKTRGRNWIQFEREAYAEILSDVDDGYASKLEKKALKRSANRSLFEEIADKLKEKFSSDEFILENLTCFKKGTVEYSPLDLSVSKLREQYNNMKKIWKEISDEPRKRSGIAARPVSFIIKM